MSLQQALNGTLAWGFCAQSLPRKPGGLHLLPVVCLVSGMWPGGRELTGVSSILPPSIVLLNSDWYLHSSDDNEDDARMKTMRNDDNTFIICNIPLFNFSIVNFFLKNNCILYKFI